ncbi:shikimate dehydrogenase [Gangjinia marincola]|uniref:Shikimate dehydrogenase n=1 Tax=Gangjinia marincola TaxID=578463 RepID=A0ABN1MIL2_9FLAO
MNKYGLIGKDVSYSYSKQHFEQKFTAEDIKATYQNFDISDIGGVQQIFNIETDLKGLNVTIPYKEKIIPFLDELDETAQKIGAVNTIKLLPGGKRIGYNTDAFGFIKSIFPLLRNQHTNALVLGTGGASKAIMHCLNSLGIQGKQVSRTPEAHQCSYDQLDEKIMTSHYLIINCTPLGTAPNTGQCPDIPYKFISHKHFLFDLIYNPPITKFLALGKQLGAQISNGQKMLEFQAEQSWDIWNS